MLRISHCLDNRLTDGGKFVSLTHPPHFTPQKHYYFEVSGTHFCYRLSKPQGLVRPEGLGKFKNSLRVSNPRPSGCYCMKLCLYKSTCDPLNKSTGEVAWGARRWADMRFGFSSTFQTEQISEEGQWCVETCLFLYLLWFSSLNFSTLLSTDVKIYLFGSKRLK
jgi:hypothetical protein